LRALQAAGINDLKAQRDAAQMEVAQSAVGWHKQTLQHSGERAAAREDRAGKKAEDAAWLAKQKAAHAAQAYMKQMQVAAERIKELDDMEQEASGAPGTTPDVQDSVVAYRRNLYSNQRGVPVPRRPAYY
jgi:hypothetical protein